MLVDKGDLQGIAREVAAYLQRYSVYSPLGY